MLLTPMAVFVVWVAASSGVMILKRWFAEVPGTPLYS